jgi:type I restriction enzyme S subunit
MINMREAFMFDRISDQDCERVPLTKAERESFLLEDFDLLFARQSLTYAGAGKCVLVLPAVEDRTWESHLIRVRLDPKLAWAPYYYYFFRSPQGRRLIETIIQQVAAAGIRGSDLGRLRVPRPELDVQRGIAEVLGALDDKIAANDVASDTALQLAAALYHSHIKGRSQTSMANILEPVLGGTPSRSDKSMWDGAVAWASAKDVAGATNGVILKTAETITKLAASKSRTRALPVGTVVLTARGTIGEVARLGIPAAINQSCYGFVPAEVPASCLFFAVRDAASQVRSLAHGSVFDTITMRTFHHVRMPALDSYEWSFVESVIEPILSASQHVALESMVLTRTRDALLPLLMSGKVHVEDAQQIVEETD